MATDVQARLTYLEWQPEYKATRPYKISQYVGRRKRKKQAGGSEKTTNLVFREAEPETIKDVRGLTGDPPFCLDRNGFAYVPCPPPALTKAWEYSDPWRIQKIYLPECEDILKSQVEGADEVMIFDWKIRKQKSAKERRTRNPNLQGFAKQIHIDTVLTRDPVGTPIMERIRNHIPPASHYLLSGRIQLINLWRPISGPIEDHPMAVCDRGTLDTSKLIETDMIRGEYTGTMLYPQSEPISTCQWYYMSRQDVEDVLLFKGFDTRDDCVKYTPHTSFTPLNSAESASPRVSVEVRALVFTRPTQDTGNGVDINSG
ncbi:uncharacterized protein BDV14DRAFT_163767 [Aspergillus stella-maris]|uniref:uncharacterized protein n=1 Tax=Aspergillus stella-maris TaxID=1810926 RepID=UPI003CCE0993